MAAYIVHNNHPRLTLSNSDDRYSLRRTEEEATQAIQLIIDDLPDDISDDNNVTIAKQHDRSSISIPSPWAVVLSCDVMLFGTSGVNSGFVEQNNLRPDNVNSGFGFFEERVINEWRSLLTLTALNNLLNLNITYETINLNSGSSEVDRKFYETLHELKPTNHLFASDSCWDKLTFIKINGITTAIFSSSSIVTPRYDKSYNDIKNYLDGKGAFGIIVLDASGCRFNNPVNFIVQSEIRSLFMVKWLNALKESIRELGATGNSCDKNGYGGKLIIKIEQFIGDIESNLKAESISAYNILSEQGFIKASFNEPINSCENMFDIINRIAITFDFSAHYISSKMRVRGTNLYVLEMLDSELSNIVNNKNPQVNVIIPDSIALVNKDNIFLDTLSIVFILSSGRKIQNFTSHMLPLNVLQVNCPLTEDLPPNDRLSDCYAILPIKSTLVTGNSPLGEGFDIYELKNSMRIDDLGDGSFRVSLDLVFENGILPVEKRFTNVTFIEVKPLPHISIWPYLSIKGVDGTNEWKEYYVFESAKRDAEYLFKFDLETPDLFNQFELTNAGINNEIIKSVSKYSKLPKYIRVLRADNNEEVGIIALNKPEEYQKASNNVAIVGLDFGTTSTTMFYKIIGTIQTVANMDLTAVAAIGNPKFVKFGRSYKIDYDDFSKKEYINDNSDIRREVVLRPRNTENESNEFFLDDEFHDRTAYPSIYHVNSINTSISANEVFLRGNILFDAITSVESNNDNTTVNKEIKWSNDPTTAGVLQGYLAQMLKMAAFTLSTKESVSKIILKASYPTSLPKRNLMAYKDSLTSLVNSMGNKLGVMFELQHGNTYYSESVVAAKHLGGNVSNLYACIDIGGGSSDVSLWMRTVRAGNPNSMPVNLFQVSINFASRKIFLPAISKFVLCSSTGEENSVIQDKFVGFSPIEYGAALGKARELMRQNRVNEAVMKFGSDIETALFKYSKFFMSFINDPANSNPQDKYDFHKKIIVGLYAIVHFTIKSLVLQKKSDPDSYDSSQINNLSVFFAGNGSNLLSWIDYTYIDNIGRVITKIAQNEGLIAKNGVITLIMPNPDELKTEAAKGLTFMGDSESITRDMCRERILNGEGLSFKLRNGEIITIGADSDLLENEQIMNFFDPTYSGNSEVDIVSLHRSGELDEIKKFVDMVNKEIFEDFQMMEINPDWNGLTEDFIRIYNKNIQDGLLTPTFIVGIEALLMNI